MTLSDTLTAVPDQLLEVISSTQDLLLSTVSSLADTARPLTPTLPELPFAEQIPDPAGLAGNAFAFAEKLLASQKQFSIKLIEAYTPAKSAAKTTARASKAV